MREAARAEGRPTLYDGRWRDRDPSEAPADTDPVVRIKTPQNGETTIHDLVQGKVTVANDQLDDFILLRADGTPTYMLSVVVDDHDMGVTQVIRGDDHLNNAFRQLHLFRAMEWPAPEFGHIPLIHGADGRKLSTRHGALGVEAYRDMGFLPETVRNYLLRLGWSHGDDEIIGAEQAIEWFDLSAVGRSPARFDIAKLESLNAHYIRETEDDRLVELIAPMIESAHDISLEATARERLKKGLQGLKPRAKTLVELCENASFYVVRPKFPLANARAEKLLKQDSIPVLTAVSSRLAESEQWTAEAIETVLRCFAEHEGIGFGKVAQPLRAALTGSNASPGIFEVMEILGQTETLERLGAVPETP